MRSGGWGGGSIVRISVPPLHPDPRIYDKGGVRRKDVINGAACLVRPSLPIRFEACWDLSAEFPDGLLGPLPTCSNPGVD